MICYDFPVASAHPWNSLPSSISVSSDLKALYKSVIIIIIIINYDLL